MNVLDLDGIITRERELLPEGERLVIVVTVVEPDDDLFWFIRTSDVFNYAFNFIL